MIRVAVLFGAFVVIVGVAVGLPSPQPTGPGSGLVLLGLATRSGSGGAPDVERLTDAVRRFADRIDGRPPSVAGEAGSGPADADDPVDFRLERDDEVGRLSAAIDDLATTVRDRERRRAEADRYRVALYRIASDPDRGEEETVRRLLELGCDRLDVEAAFVSRVDPETGRERIETAVGGDGWDVDPLAIDPPNVASDDVAAVHDAAGSGAGPDVGCYVAGRFAVADDREGTLSFLDPEPRDRPFSPAETSFVELLCRWTSRAVERRRYVRDGRERERRLERERAFVDDVLDAVDDVVCLLGDDGGIQRWNESLCDATGYTDAEVAGMNALEFFDERDRPTVTNAMTDALETGHARLEVPLRTAAGERIPYEFVASPLEDPDGNRVVASIGRDVTGRREREHELERAETIIQALDELVYTVDAEGRFTFLNDALTSITGYEPETLIGEHVSTLMADGDLETARDLIRDLRRADEPSRTFEMALETADGDAIDAENHVALLPTTDGGFAGTAGVIRDVTERTARKRELERTTELLEQAERLAGIGGWELDAGADPPEVTLTDGLRRLYELPLDAAVDPELAASFPHPDDRSRVGAVVDAALEDGESYELEHRMVTAAGAERWVRSTGEPIRDGADSDGEITGVRGTIQDITEAKERALALESLHGVARDLLGTGTESAVAALVVEAADEILEASGAAVYRLDADVNALDPIARTDGFAALCDATASVGAGDGDSVLWDAYVAGTGAVVDDPATFDRSRVFGSDVEDAVVVPIGDHGVLAVATGAGPIDDGARRLIETLVATTEAAFDRLESETGLREREAELAERNRRLNRQITITEFIRGIDQSLVGADSRAEIERTVPERLLEADLIDFAWIGTVDAGGTELEPRAWAGSGREYLTDVPLAYEGSAEPAVRTARSGSPTVVSNVVEGLRAEGWRRHALDRSYQSVLSVPLSYAEYTYGVLTVYADEPDAFADLERTVLTELGAGIANAITAAKTREALHADRSLELTLRLEGTADLLARIASASGACVEYEGLGTHAADESLLFFETSGVPADDVQDALEDLVSVTDHRLVSDSGEDCRFEATVAGEVVASRLVRHGGSPRAIRADETGTELTVDVPTGTDVREFVGTLEEGYPSVELLARRHVERSLGTRRDLVTSLLDALTDRQREVLRTAYFAGFFEWPRESTGEEIADLLGVSQPTVNRHLRIGQRRLVAQLFEPDGPQ
jgi:PAS domain S-box-containing protein